jgi:hypothetical protein
MIKKSEISEFRKKIGTLLKSISYLSTRYLYEDSLIQGSPAIVYRKCGKTSCKCVNDEASRHGPYKVIQIFSNKKSRQICLRKDQEEYWEHAKNYQFQIEKYLELKQSCNELLNIVNQAIQKRIMEFPQDESKKNR